jgi:hypothetical protein
VPCPCVFGVYCEALDLRIRIPAPDVLDNRCNDGLIAEVLIADMPENTDRFRLPMGTGPEPTKLDHF